MSTVRPAPGDVGLYSEQSASHGTFRLQARPTRSWFAGRPRLEEFLAILSLVTALCAELVLIRVGLEAQDEGYFVEQASRVLRGDLPYRDFDSLYTPALLYLHAGLFRSLGSPNVIAVRAVGLIARVLLAGGLYALCRPLARPMVAVLPGMYVLVALDRVPFAWEPHPGWPSAALTVLAVLTFARVTRLSHSQRRRSLIAIGAITALVFAFKQNAGVFLGLALIVYTAWQGVEVVSTAVTRALRVTQILLLLAVLLAVAWLIRAHASPLVAGYFVVPIVAAGVVSLRAVSVDRGGRTLSSWLSTLGFLGLGFCVITVPWMAVLISALDARIEFLAGFVGAVDQEFLWHPFDGATSGAWASLVGSAVAVVLALRVRHQRHYFLASLGLMLVFGWCGVLLTAQAGDAVWQALLLAPGRAADGIPVVLPIVCILAAVWWSVRSPPTVAGWRLRWMTVASALTLLAEYPRLDEAHLAWSACLALATGAVVLGQVYATLVDRWSLHALGRGVLAAALVAVPVATSLPNLLARTAGFLEKANPVRVVPRATVMGLPGFDGVMVTGEQSATLVATAIYVRDTTTPGEPIFVYPTSPLLYVLADRPNPTRFAHLYPGAASADQLNQVMAALGQLPVRVVVVSAAGLLFWGPPAINHRLEEYLAARYRDVARFGEYRVLIQTAPTP